MQVRVEGAARDVRSLLRRAPGPQAFYEYAIQPSTLQARIICVDREGPAPFAVTDGDTVTICSWQSRGIAQYANLWRGDYLLLLSILGLTKLQALRRNPVLIAEDLSHGYSCGCLFEHRPLWDDYAVLLECPHVCDRCFRFYDTLCGKDEMTALRAMAAYAVEHHDPIGSHAGKVKESRVN